LKVLYSTQKNSIYHAQSNDGIDVAPSRFANGDRHESTPGGKCNSSRIGLDGIQ
jgi:hypothetical protein